MDDTLDILADDFLEDGSNSGSEGIDEVNLIDEYQQEVLSDMEFPSIAIEGLLFELEFEYLRDRPYKEESALPLYCSVDGVISRIGMLDMTLDSLLTLSKVANYKLHIYRSKDDIVEIDLNNPEFLEKFIKL